MGACSVSGSGKVYRPRNPRATKLYQIVSGHVEEFLEVYPQRFERKYGGLRPEVVRTLENYLRCGILSYGFARVKCPTCHHEYLLAFSCKGRYFCPSCHQRRVLEFSTFLTEHILEEVAHRQIVFSLPKMLRVYFLYNRTLLPKLSHCGWETIMEVFQETLGRDDVVPGLVMDIQTYGRWGNWNPHLHSLCTDGCFDVEGNFYPLPRISTETLEKVFVGKVLAMLVKEELIGQEVVRKIRSWKHSGFSAHANVRLKAGDRKGLKALAEYIVRSPISESKILLSDDGSKVIYRDNKLNPSAGRNFETFDVLEFLAALTSHIPAAGRKQVIYYGYYSQPARGKRRREGRLTIGGSVALQTVDGDNKQMHYRWSELIKMVYADPLICPACGGRMRIIAFIEERSIIERILRHLGLSAELEEHIHSPPLPLPSEGPVIYEPFFDDLPEDEQMDLMQQVMN